MVRCAQPAPEQAVGASIPSPVILSGSVSAGIRAQRVPGSPALQLRQAPPTQGLLLQALLLKEEPATARSVPGAPFSQTGMSEHLYCLKQGWGD